MPILLETPQKHPLLLKCKPAKDVRINEETRRSIARKSFILKIFSKIHLEAATKRCSLKLVVLKC